MWDSRDNRCYSLPFYNFYNDGRTCLGDLEGRMPKNEPLKALNLFLSAYTTPHATYNDKQCSFQPNDALNKIVTSRVPKHTPFDWDLDADLFAKPIARIRPC